MSFPQNLSAQCDSRHAELHLSAELRLHGQQSAVRPAAQWSVHADRRARAERVLSGCETHRQHHPLTGH